MSGGNVALSADPDRAPRKPWLAVLLSILVPGLGQLYAGAPARALIVYLSCSIASYATVRLAGSNLGKPLLALILAVALAIETAVCWDAYRCAVNATVRDIERPRYQWYVLAMALVLGYLGSRSMRQYLLANVLRAYHVPSDAMSPVVRSGDYILATPRPSALDRSQVVVYIADGTSFVKRILAVGGDTVSMTSGRLFINQRPLDEPYTSETDSDRVDSLFEWQRQYLVSTVDRAQYKPSLRTWGPLVVPSGDYFVLGDNRDRSEDSRYTGFVVPRDVVARVTSVYFSRDPVKKRVRWERIGIAVR